MEIIGYIASLFIGISLGLIGGGGSVLTVPILVYLFNVEPVLATAYSLFIVGSSSVVGAVQKYKNEGISFKTAFIFGIPSVITVYLIRKFIIPLIPEIIYNGTHLVITRGTLTLSLFSILMIAAAIGMLKPQKISRPALPEVAGLTLLGVVVGCVSGLLGAGGGFIIIPALIFYASMDMKRAVGTSLLIISLNSLVGFTGDLHHQEINWSLLITIGSLAIFGTWIGHMLSGRIPSSGIKKIFAWFIMITGLCILFLELGTLII